MKATINNLDKVSIQDVFQTVGAHLIKQGEKAKVSDGGCFYKIGKLRCAAGVLIPLKQYRSSFEGKGWSELCEIHDFPRRFEVFISKLQEIHDNIEPAEWRKEFKLLGYSEGLDNSFLETI